MIEEYLNPFNDVVNYSLEKGVKSAADNKPRDTCSCHCLIF